MSVPEAVQARIADQARSGVRRSLLVLIASEAAAHGTTLAVVIESVLTGQISPSFGPRFDRQVRLMGVPRAGVLDLVREIRERPEAELGDLLIVTQALSSAPRPPTVDQANELVNLAKRVYRSSARFRKASARALDLVPAPEEAPPDGR